MTPNTHPRLISPEALTKLKGSTVCTSKFRPTRLTYTANTMQEGDGTRDPNHTTSTLRWLVVREEIAALVRPLHTE